MNAHLFLDGAAGHAIALAGIVVLVRNELRHDEQRNPFRAFGSAFDAGQHQMDDIVGKVVFAGRDKNLLARNPVAAIAIGDSLGAKHAEIGSAMRLRQIHGAGPVAFDHLRQELALLFVGSVNLNCRDRTLRQAGIHRKCHVRGRQIFANR